MNKLGLLHGYSDDVIPYQPLMPLYTITDLENVPSTNYTHTTHIEKFDDCDHRGLDCLNELKTNLKRIQNNEYRRTRERGKNEFKRSLNQRLTCCAYSLRVCSSYIVRTQTDHVACSYINKRSNLKLFFYSKLVSAVLPILRTFCKQSKNIYSYIQRRQPTATETIFEPGTILLKVQISPKCNLLLIYDFMAQLQNSIQKAFYSIV